VNVVFISTPTISRWLKFYIKDNTRDIGQIIGFSE